MLQLEINFLKVFLDTRKGKKSSYNNKIVMYIHNIISF